MPLRAFASTKAACAAQVAAGIKVLHPLILKKVLNCFPGAVRTGIVDDQNFIRKARLGKQRLQALTQQFLSIAGDNHRSNFFVL